MSSKIVKVTIDVSPAVVPLVAGYLQSEACLDPEIKEKRILRQRMNFVGGVMRIRRPQKQQPLSDMHYGSSRHWNYRSFRMITSRPPAATWNNTQLAANVA